MKSASQSISWISLIFILVAAGFPRDRSEAGPDSPDSNLVKKIQRVIVQNGRKQGATWFHPRACMVPTANGKIALMTMQSISGSDVFGHVHWTESDDLGKSWTKPKKIPGLGRKSKPGAVQEGVCDVVPEFHPKTNTVLAIGHNVFYKNDRLMRPQPPRFPVYVVRDANGKWSAPKKLIWDDPRGSLIYTCGCGQRTTLPDGDVLIPISFAPKGKADRAVTSLLCGFDGKTLTVKKTGNELRLPVKRGLLEPSMTRYNDDFYMTIRAEDGHGYVTTSKDGLTWQKITPWKWDDGGPITMSTTQQHWLSHSDGLFLVYTRKAKENANVFRWRAPLYLAEVDVKMLRLMRSTERVALPLIGDGVKNAKHVARMGNFHTTAVSPQESWVTVGETLPHDGWNGDLLLARIIWNRPNRLVN